MSKTWKPLFLIAGVAFGVLLVTTGGVESEDGATPVPTPGPSHGSGAEAPATTVPCPAGGYLCANVERAAAIRVRRWAGPTATTLVVHVPMPDFESPGEAARLQSAAAAGVRAWNGHPFPVRVDTRDAESAHFAVRWVPTLDGAAVGVARTRWSAAGGLEVTSIDLATRNPFAPGALVDPDRVRLTAAHEMGHALGLPHSDSDRDVMYPTNTAASLTARDYRSMEALYALPDGALLEP